MKTANFRLFLLTTFLALISGFSHSQLQREAYVPCFSDELLREQIKKNPALESRIAESDWMIRNHGKGTSGNAIEKSGGSANLIVPVVVYIVHGNGPENISDLQVISQIDALNTYYAPVGIQFCLATKKGSQDLISLNSPSGVVSTTPGIFHYNNGTLTNHNVSQTAALTAVGAALSEENYLRIWVVKSITSNGLPPGERILGYSNFPQTSPGANDGIVMSYDAFGDIATCGCTTLEPYSNMGKIAVHETGHYFGLYHTFQGGCQGVNASNCETLGDQVCDTPPVASPNNGCPSTGWNTCYEAPDLPDDIHNYMDYVSESCMTGFTDGQSDRIFSTINYYRSNLVSSDNLVYTGVQCTGGLFCDFTATGYDICINNSITFTAQPSSGATYSWDFGDGTSGSGQVVTHTYSSAQLPANVVLTISNGTNTLSATRSVFVQDCVPIQSEQGVWYYGQTGGMDFSSGSPVYSNEAHNHGNYFSEASAVQCDDQGNLLFYTNGEEVWDSNHNPINLSALLKSDDSAHRGALIVPGTNTDEYYLFTKDAGFYGGTGTGSTYTLPDTNGFRYSIIDMSSGSAAMSASWNVAITPPLSLGYQLGFDNAMMGSEGVAAVKSCDGYWILTTGKKANDYYITLFSLTASGLIFHSETISPFNGTQQSIEVSRDGKRLALASGSHGNTETGGLAVYDFDPVSGSISNQQILNNKMTYGVSFSPDGKLMYSSQWGTTGVYQFDMESASPATSGILMSASGAPDMQLGPDDKLYLSSGTNYVHVIHKPNLRNSASNPNACQFTPYGPQMQTTTIRSMPNMIDATATRVFSNSIDVEQLSCFSYQFSAGVCASSFSWNFGDPASGFGNNVSLLEHPTHVFSGPGTYTVSFSSGGSVLFTTTVEVGITATINGASTLCLLQNNTGNYSTNLEQGQTASWSVSANGGISGLSNQPDVTVIWTSLPGTVTLQLTDTETGCVDTKVYTVTESCTNECVCSVDPFYTYTTDENLCKIFFQGYTGGSPCLQNVVYNWDLGDGTSTTGTAPEHTYLADGTYSVCLTITADGDNGSCENSYCQDVTINCIPPCPCELNPTLLYTFDEKTCSALFTGINGGDSCLQNVSYSWDFGDGTNATGQAPSHTYQTAGNHNVCLTVSANNGSETCTGTVCKQVSIPECEEPCDCELKPGMKIAFNKDECLYTFTGISGGPDCLKFVEYYWNFGDGTTAIGQVTGHVFPGPGTYEVCLTVVVKDEKGNVLCEKRICKRIDVECDGECKCEVKPTFSMESIDGCQYLFTGISGATCANVKEIQWYIDDNFVSTGQQLLYSFSANKYYKVCMVVIAYTTEEECHGEYCTELFFTDCDPPVKHTPVATEEEALEEIRLLPNPATAAFNVQFSQPEFADAEIVLRSTDGRIINQGVYHMDQHTGTITVDIPETVTNGFILVEINAGGDYFVKKLLIIRD